MHIPSQLNLTRYTGLHTGHSLRAKSATILKITTKPKRFVARAELTDIFSNDNIRTAVTIGATSLSFFGGTFVSTKNLRNKSDKKFTEMKEDSDKNFREMREDSDRKFREMREDSDRKFKEMREDSDRKFREMKEDSDRKFSDINKNFSEIRIDYNAKFNQLADKIERLSDKVDRNYESNLNRLFLVRDRVDVISSQKEN